ncbi:hypothetical protein C4564_05210 [Candidatus Microgenomates bacterium]|nr:MAG: hypothetical protein C4564_05210 [Candidatus Microgenomates bacterium]
METTEMVEATQKVKEKRESPLGVDELCAKAKEAHSEFVDQVWRKDDPDRESFHDDTHVDAVWKSAETALEQQGDPLKVWEDLEKWNKEKGTNISRDEFKIIAKLAIHAHDMGNIMNGLSVKDGKFEPDYHADGYKSEGAEARSQEIFNEMVNASEMDLTDEQKQAYIALGRQLIGVTVPNFKDTPDVANEPFRLFMETCDQVGGNMNSDKPLDNMLLGLATELASENKMPTINPSNFYNFAYTQLDRLMKGREEAKEQIKKAWGMEGNSRVDPLNWPNENMKIEDFINMLKARIDEPEAIEDQIRKAGAWR